MYFGPQAKLAIRVYDFSVKPFYLIGGILKRNLAREHRILDNGKAFVPSKIYKIIMLKLSANMNGGGMLYQ